MSASNLAMVKLHDAFLERINMASIEYWRWRYRDPKTGRTCRTVFQLTADEAAKYSDAERIPGTMLLRETDDEPFTETAPGAFRLQSL